MAHVLSFRDKIAVVVCTVTDDNRLLDVPKMTIAALRFTETARARIIKAGAKTKSEINANKIVVPVKRPNLIMLFTEANTSIKKQEQRIIEVMKMARPALTIVC